VSDRRPIHLSIVCIDLDGARRAAYRRCVSDSAARTFRAILVRDDGGPPRAVTLPTEVNVPPSRVRIPAEYVGASAFEVFELADDRSWPTEATYRLVATIPRSTADLPARDNVDWEVDDFDGDGSSG
jgi:hypothetical protein